MPSAGRIPPLGYASGMTSTRPPEPDPLPPPVARGLSADVHELLLELLLDPSCPPGSPLNIDRLAARWDVSATPVREALARAAATGLVEHRQNHGYRAAPMLPPSDYQALMDVRALIEPYCAGRAAERITAAQAAELEDLQLAMEHAATGPTASEYRPYLRADIRFHRTIVAAAANRFVLQAFDGWNTHFFRFQRFGGRSVADATISHPEHRAIIDAIRRHDAEAARAAMAAHVEGVRRRS